MMMISFLPEHDMTSIFDFRSAAAALAALMIVVPVVIVGVVTHAPSRIR